jgi:hypothetical protein
VAFLYHLSFLFKIIDIGYTERRDAFLELICGMKYCQLQLLEQFFSVSEVPMIKSSVIAFIECKRSNVIYDIQ